MKDYFILSYFILSYFIAYIFQHWFPNRVKQNMVLVVLEVNVKQTDGIKLTAIKSGNEQTNGPAINLTTFELTYSTNYATYIMKNCIFSFIQSPLCCSSC